MKIFKLLISIMFDIMIISMIVVIAAIFIGGTIYSIVAMFIYQPYWFGIVGVAVSLVGSVILIGGAYVLILIKMSIVSSIDLGHNATKGVIEAFMNNRELQDIDFSKEEQ